MRRRHRRTSLQMAVGILAAAVAAAALTASQPARPPQAPDGAVTPAELWQDPGNIAAKDLRWGRGGQALAPSADVEYEFTASDVVGYSPGYDVIDPQGRKWDVKTGDEGQPEVLASRLLWAIGYHQPVVYFVPEWRMKKGPVLRPASGRFRLSSDHETDGEWSWTDPRFKGTRQFKGLIVANLLINNWDLKPSQNRIYTDVASPGGVARWFVVQDLGASFGKTGWPVGNRNNIDDFESQRFVLGVENGRVQFDYRARHRELLADITPADVVWTCELFSRITDRQWAELFSGAAMSDDRALRYTRKLKTKIAEGLALRARGAY